jgi:hypothetical protein
MFSRSSREIKSALRLIVLLLYYYCTVIVCAILYLLSKMFLARDEVTWEWRKLRNEEINPLNAELNPICHLLILLGDLMFMGPCIISISCILLDLRVY